MSAIPSEETILGWFFTPSKAKRAEKPKRSHDARVDSIKESIQLTMEYLAATSKPFEDGRPRLIEGRTCERTLFWSIYETRSDEKIVVDGETKTVTTILYYGFDASGALTVETVRSESFEDMYHNRYSWPESTDVPMAHRIKLNRKLKEFRASLVVS